MSLSITESQSQIKSEFLNLATTDDKWKYLLQLAREHESIDDSIKDEKFLIKGCATRLFLIPKFETGVLHFYIDTDSGSDSPLIVRGLAHLAWRVYNGQSPADILSSDIGFFQEIGLNVALSATRANGFASLLKQIFLYARVFQATLSK